jgi:rhodanese-related sulfurtransferase
MKKCRATGGGETGNGSSCSAKGPKKGLCRAYTPPPFAAAVAENSYGAFDSLLGSSSDDDSDDTSDGGTTAAVPEPEPEPASAVGTVCAPLQLPPSRRGSGLAALRLPSPQVTEHVEPSQLQALLAQQERSGDAAGEVIVVDVRSSEERADGHIAGSVHVPSEQWSLWHHEWPDEGGPSQVVRKGLGSDARALLDRVADSCSGAGGDDDGPLLIFHCMYSRERAPRAAQNAADADPCVRVAVLRGGFQQMMAQLWVGGGASDGGGSGLLVDVVPERWLPNGRQGLVYAPDLAMSLME